ncbi:hypothetical protein [Streptomyces sp. NPDC006996]
MAGLRMLARACGVGEVVSRTCPA